MRRVVASVIVLVMALATLAGGSASAHGGPRPIEFGLKLHGTKLVHVQTSFARSKNVAWLAQVGKIPAGKLTVRLTQTTGPGPHPSVIRSWTVKLRKPVSVLTGTWTARHMKKMHLSAATFRLDYLRGRSLVATGSWTRLNCANCKGNSGPY